MSDPARTLSRVVAQGGTHARPEAGRPAGTRGHAGVGRAAPAAARPGGLHRSTGRRRVLRPEPQHHLRGPERFPGADLDHRLEAAQVLPDVAGRGLAAVAGAGEGGRGGVAAADPRRARRREIGSCSGGAGVPEPAGARARAGAGARRPLPRAVRRAGHLHRACPVRRTAAPGTGPRRADGRPAPRADRGPRADPGAARRRRLRQDHRGAGPCPAREGPRIPGLLALGRDAGRPRHRDAPGRTRPRRPRAADRGRLGGQVQRDGPGLARPGRRGTALAAGRRQRRRAGPHGLPVRLTR